MRLIKKSIILLLVVCLILLNTGCWGNREPDEVAYVLAIGVDKGEVNRYKVTYLIANSVAIGQGEAPGKEGLSVITSVEVPSIPVGLDMANTYIGRRMTLIHTKLFLFSEELARSGVAADALGAISLAREVRGSSFIGIAKGSAAEVVEGIKPKFETNPSKYIELIMTSGRYTGITPEEQILDTAYIDFHLDGINAVLPLFSLSIEEKQKKGETGDLVFSKGQKEDYPAGVHKAGDIPREGGTPIEVMGGAAFKGNAMVGDMNGNDLATWLMMRGDYNQRIYRLTDPTVKNKVISLVVTQGRKPKIKVSIVDGKPIINAKITLEGNMIGLQSQIDYQQPDKQDVLIKAFEERLIRDAKDLIMRTQKEYKSDIFGFGIYARRLFWTDDQWKEFNWSKAYEEAEIKVDFDFSLRRSGTLIKVKPTVQPEKGIKEGENE